VRDAVHAHAPHTRSPSPRGIASGFW
jgi:hypothetical protein